MIQEGARRVPAHAAAGDEEDGLKQNSRTGMSEPSDGYMAAGFHSRVEGAEGQDMGHRLEGAMLQVLAVVEERQRSPGQVAIVHSIPVHGIVALHSPAKGTVEAVGGREEDKGGTDVDKGGSVPDTKVQAEGTKMGAEGMLKVAGDESQMAHMMEEGHILL